MSLRPTREEMIKMAVETRKQVTSAVVSREEMERYPARVAPMRIPVRAGDSQAFLVSAQGGEEQVPLVINMHGGGFIKQRTENDELFCRKLALATGCKILDVDYRVAPEHPFPAGLNECYDVAVWAWKNGEQLGIDREKIILCGHSAGGNFVVGISMLLHESGIFKPLGIISEYPPLDLSADPAQKEQRGRSIPAERARLYNLYYCEEELQKHPLASPVMAGEEQLKDFPRALFITAGEDSLCNEAEAFALKAARAGNEVTVKRFEKAGHGFTIYRMPGHEEALKLIERFIQHLLIDCK